MHRYSEQLRIPGPTPVPERVTIAAGRAMMNHRGEKFAELLRTCVSGLQRTLATHNDVLLFPASGTGGLEAATSNLVNSDHRVLVCVNGWFGQLWADLCAAFGAEVVRLDSNWGAAIDPRDVDRVLAANADITTVFLTHNETSTGVTNDIAGVAAAVKRRHLLLVVDSVGGAGCIPLETDKLGIDVVVTASQKGWLCPPGLTMVAVSPAAIERAAQTSNPRFYFDFVKQKQSHDRGETHTTPPLSTLYALAEGLRIREEEGLEAVLARHRSLADKVRSGVIDLGLELYADPSARSDSVTAIRNPFDTSAELGELLRRLRDHYQLILAGGHGPLHGQIFRIGHMGDIAEGDVNEILGRLALGLTDLSYGPFRDLARIA